MVMLKFCPNNAKNLGFTLDCHLTMNDHVTTIAQTYYLYLRRMASIQRFLTNIATATHVSAFVLSIIDFRNSLLSGSAQDATSHLQRISELCNWINLPKSSNITKHLKSLHWSAVEESNIYKMVVLCYH